MTKRILLFAVSGVCALSAGCWCPCEVHGTTLPLPPQQQCAQPAQPAPAEQAPASQPTGTKPPPREGAPASQPTR